MQDFYSTLSASEQTPSIFNKCYQTTKADKFRSLGIYPYFHVIEENEGPIVNINGKKIIMAGSNNYLGLTSHPKVKEAAIKAIEKYGTSCSGSRFLTGTLDLHLELESRLAAFMGRDAALIFSTGYQTSQGVIQPLVGRNDYILSDKENHASIVSATLITKGTGNSNLIRYKHNDMEDLELQLKKIPWEAGKMIVSDGVFSTFGNIVNLEKLHEIARRYHAQIILDDAHAFGVIGDKGRGTASQFGLSKEVDLTFCTFSKTLASIGGFVTGDARVIDFLKHESPAFMFSASPSPASTASALAALTILEQEPDRVSRLRYNTGIVRKELRRMGYEVPDGETAIVPIILYDTEKACLLWQGLFEEGIFVNMFIPPAVPEGKAMLRNSFMATHEESQLVRILYSYEIVGKKLGII
jgi:8-amino-7-oxononanoate synthase